MADPDREVWEMIAEILTNHLGSRSTLCTLNRLFGKVPSLQNRDDLPVLSRKGVRISKQSISRQELVTYLEQPGQETESKPHRMGAPVVLVKWNQTTYVIDGRRRINVWRRTGDSEHHDAIIVEVA